MDRVLAGVPLSAFGAVDVGVEARVCRAGDAEEVLLLSARRLGPAEGGFRVAVDMIFEMAVKTSVYDSFASPVCSGVTD